MTDMKNARNRNEMNDDEVEIDLVPLMYAVWNHLAALLLTSIVVGVATYFILFVTNVPMYCSKFNVYVNNRSNSGSTEFVTSGDISASQSLAKTYTTILESQPLVMQAAEKAEVSNETKELLETKSDKVISIENVQGTEIIEVSVILKDANEAYNLANAMVKIGPKYLQNIVEGSSMKIIDFPKVAKKAEPSKMVKKSLIATLLAFIVFAMMVVIAEFRNNAIRSEKELKDRFELPVLGVVPNIQESYYADEAKSYASYGG